MDNSVITKYLTSYVQHAIKSAQRFTVLYRKEFASKYVKLFAKRQYYYLQGKDIDDIKCFDVSQDQEGTIGIS